MYLKPEVKISQYQTTTWQLNPKTQKCRKAEAVVQMFLKIGALKNIVIFTEKHLR